MLRRNCKQNYSCNNNQKQSNSLRTNAIDVKNNIPPCEIFENELNALIGNEFTMLIRNVCIHMEFEGPTDIKDQQMTEKKREKKMTTKTLRRGKLFSQ